MAEEASVPSELLQLAPVAGTLLTVASNPKEWLRGFVFELIAEWVVGGILDFSQYTLGWVIFAYERSSSILLTAIPPLQAPFRIFEDAVVGVIETMYGLAIGVAQTAGLAGPPAAAFATVLLGTLLAAATWGILSVIPGSDLIEGATGAFRR
jgi:hypothetical protein